MVDEAKAWNSVAKELGISVDAPCDLRLPDGTRVRATAHVKQFGAVNGMIVDPDFAVLEPYTDALDTHGYGFSAISIVEDTEDMVDTEGMVEVLADWGWSASGPAPAWLPEVKDREAD